jgi:hypothetical protein
MYIYNFLSNCIKLYECIYFKTYTYIECKSQTIYTHNIGWNI